MQSRETPGNPGTPVGSVLNKRPHRPATYQKVLDARKHPVRGLWVRNGRYYARLAIPDPDTGVTQIRRVPLEAAESDAEAQAALRRLSCCGSRMSETLRLKWTDVKWTKDQLEIGSDGLAKNG
ncbi:MAG: hypothetical protein RL514_2619 [Verrucomicrobiota bacterium]|jgi:integrase